MIRVGTTELAVLAGEPREGGLSLETRFGKLLGASVAMRQVFGILEKVCGSDTNVLLAIGVTFQADFSGPCACADAMPDPLPGRVGFGGISVSVRVPRVLVVDDDASLRQTMGFIVETNGYRARLAETGREALEICAAEHVDLMLLDIQLPDIHGLEVLAQVRDRYPDIAVAIVSVVKDLTVAIKAMQLGALDYLTKDFSPTELNEKVAGFLRQRQANKELALHRAHARARNRRPMILGASAAARAMLTLADAVANTSATVLITGETGTGKEVLARYLHEKSSRAAAPFEVVHLPAISSTLIESELFGHERGAFTGATATRQGAFELADGGTVFLDELAEFPVHLQAKILRVVEEKEVRRVGGSKSIPLDVRIIGATNKELRTEVSAGRFREDLYWRLKRELIVVPPLRARIEDIPFLAEHFLGVFSAGHHRSRPQLSEECLSVLQGYPWEGNVRELKSVMEHLVIHHKGLIIEPSNLPREMLLQAAKAASSEQELSYATALATAERQILLGALDRSEGNKKLAAERLDIGYSTLRARLKALGRA